MIYKINSDFTDLKTILNKFKHYNTLFFNGSLYVADGEEKINKKNIIKNLRQEKFILELNEYNLSTELPYVQQWCKQQFIIQDKIEYEKNNQKQLQTIMKTLQDIELTINKKRGDNDARRKKKKR